MKVEIFDLSDKAEGIGRIDGKIVFVKNAIPGETVDVEITEDKGSLFKAAIIGGASSQCDGAPLLRMPYNEQLAWKEKHVSDCLTRLAKIKDFKMNPIVGMENPYNYRNKGEFKVKGKLPYCNVGCKDCKIQSKKALEVLEHFREHPVKNAEELIVRTNANDEVLSYTIQSSGYPLLFEGVNLINDYIGDLKVEVDAASFYQVNTSQCVKLYSIVKSYVDEGSFLLDLYCGAGTIGLFCADKCSKVIGVESVKPAIIQANRNAVINGNINATFICGKAEEVVPTKLQGVKADIVVVDPPRAGCKKSLLETVVQIAPKKLIYVSCNPATLARDLNVLSELKTAAGDSYVVDEVTPVDMFPHTVHVETVCLLVLRNPVTHVNIDVDVEELVHDKRGQATYPQIEEYVLEQTGLKVSSLYISQIKRKCGLDVGDSYNKPKSEDARVPQCPPEKEKAIMDALRHFGMIS